MSRQARIRSQLTAQMQPEHLEVLDESHQHAVPSGAESHFKLVIVSAAFAGQTLIKRHRIVNELLRTEFEQGLHAAAIHAFTPAEWQEKGAQAPASPKCRGGSKAKLKLGAAA